MIQRGQNDCVNDIASEKQLQSTSTVPGDFNVIGDTTVSIKTKFVWLKYSQGKVVL